MLELRLYMWDFKNKDWDSTFKLLIKIFYAYVNLSMKLIKFGTWTL